MWLLGCSIFMNNKLPVPLLEDMADKENISAVEQVTVRLNPCSGHDASSVPEKVISLSL